MSDRVTRAVLDDGAIWRVTFGATKGNVLDCATMGELNAVFREARTAPALKAVCLEGAGAHFSYGASVQEHLPGQVEPMLAAIRQLAFDILDSDVVVVAVVRGQCLGGGLEVASLCHRIVASATASLGQPEITLGLFAPIASLVLPERIRRADAERICLTGQPVGAAEALAIGIVDEVSAGDPMVDALAWLRTHTASKSASSLRLAVRAIRMPFAARFKAMLPEIERVYLEQLMPTHDAVEGVQAFLEKRTPVWRGR